MAYFRDTEFIFIVGVEGSGTTMMSRLLEKLPGYYSVGGNHCQAGFESLARQVNDLTAELWRLPRISSIEKQHILAQLENIVLPDKLKTCVNKRSYPFISHEYMPDLDDFQRLACSYKVVVLRRHFIDSVRSIMRRGFEGQEVAAIKRIAQGHMHLTQQLLKFDAACLLTLDYEKLIDDRTKKTELARLAHFLGIDEALVQTHSGLIGKPSAG